MSKVSQRSAAAASVVLACALVITGSRASTPSSGNLSLSNTVINYGAGPFTYSNQTGQASDPPVCSGSGQDCDYFDLTVDLPSDYHTTHPNDSVVWTISWPEPTGQEDYDEFWLDAGGTVVKNEATNDSTVDPDVLSLPACPGTVSYKLLVVPWLPNGTSYTAKVELKTGTNPVNCPSTGGGGTPPADQDHDGVPDTADACPGTSLEVAVQDNGCPYPPTAIGTPVFHTFMSQGGAAASVGEPSIGCNWKSEQSFHNFDPATDSANPDIPNGGTANFFGGFSPVMASVTFDDCQSPAKATWAKKAVLTSDTPRVFGDPILFTDHDTGRTFVVQEEGLTPAGSTIDITDDDGNNFVPSDPVGSDVDHETVGAGPYHLPIPSGVNLVYPNAVYYASQAIADARAHRSDDGGLTWGPGVPMYTLADCGGLHGHIKVGSDGTVYVPNKDCGSGEQAVVVSEDNGVTWNVRTVPGTDNAGNDDPSVGVATDGKTIYLGMQSADDHPRIAVSHDWGNTWSTPVDVGANVVNGKPVLNIAFPEVVAGDPNRAAFAFFGTESGGGSSESQSPSYTGVWYLYIATTFDGGATWTTQNVTPRDPIQRGGICDSGTCRNLLDFFDMTIDKEGRVLVGGEDGCITGACIEGGANDFTAKGFMTRQAGGKRMFALFDPVEPARPGAPALSGKVNGPHTAVNLTWQTPYDGRSNISGYNIYRREGTSGPFSLLGTSPTNTFKDSTFDKNIETFYHVTAVNGIGEGPWCANVTPSLLPPETVCEIPGVTILDDDKNDQQGGAEFDIESLRVAEPEDMPGKIIVTFKVGNFATGVVPSGTRWAIRFNGPNAPPAGQDDFFIEMTTERSDTPEFLYGTTGVTTDPSGTAGARTFQIAGTLGDSKFTTDGAIQLVLDRDNPLIGPLHAGDFLIKMFPSVRAPATPGNAGIYDQGDETFYKLRGDLDCHVNEVPTAALSASPLSGTAPLTVTFDASGSSDPDLGDSVASYQFAFGDDSGLQSDHPGVSHTYNQPGDYTATVTVADTHDYLSTNTTPVKIKVVAPKFNVPPVARGSYSPTIVHEGDIVTLDGHLSSDANEDDTLTYHWAQDPADLQQVDLPNPDQDVVTFEAPYGLADPVLHFALTVMDHPAGATDTADVAVTVRHAVIPVAATPAVENNHLGGALSWLALFPLGLAGLARRALKGFSSR